MPSGKRGETSFGPLNSLLRHSFASESGAAGACPGPDDLGAYFDHTLPDAETKRIETHFAGCPDCRTRLAILARGATPLEMEAHRERKWLRLWNPVWLVPTAALIVAALWTGIRWPLYHGAKARSAASPPAIVVMNQQLPVAPIAQQAPASAGDYHAQPRAKLSQRSRNPLALAKPAAPAPPTGLNAQGGAGKTAELDGLVKRAAPAPEVADQTAQAASGRETQAADAAVPQVLSTPSAEPASGAKKAQTASAIPRLSGLTDAELETVRAIPGTVVIPAPTGTVEWRVGPRGSIESSSDGQNWSKQDSGTTSDLFGGFAVSDKVCWVVGRTGMVLLTTDGQTWRRLNAPSKLDLVSVTAQNEKSATVGAAGGQSYSTDDGGQSWHAR